MATAFASWIPAIASAVGSLANASSQNRSADVQRDLGRRQLGMSQEMLDWWKTNTAPYQLGLMEKAGGLYDEAELSEADYSRALGEASGDVSRSYGGAREATMRGLSRYGVSPTSGRFGTLMTRLGGQQAAAEAAARNRTRTGLRESEFGRKIQALNVAGALNAPNYSLLGQGVAQFNVGAGTQIGASNLSAQSAGQLASGLGQAAGDYYGSRQPPPDTYTTNTSGTMTAADGGEIGMMRRYRQSADRVDRDMAGARGLRRKERFMGDATRMDTPMGGLGMRQIRGEMRGPGTPISDSIPVTTEDGTDARLADGEVVMPTDTVASLGLQLIRRDPERAAHMLGVKLLEEQIDQTHEPAESQEKNGLSVNPRGREEYANGGESKRPSLGAGMAESAAKALEARKKRLEEAMKAAGLADGGMVGYADGQESDWRGGLAAVGKGLINAYSGGAWTKGEQQARSERLENTKLAQAEEERQFQLGQRERALAEQKRLDEYSSRMRGLATQRVPLAGPPQGAERSIGERPLSAQEFMEQAGQIRREYLPEQYAPNTLTAEETKAIGLPEGTVVSRSEKGGLSILREPKVTKYDIGEIGTEGGKVKAYIPSTPGAAPIPIGMPYKSQAATQVNIGQEKAEKAEFGKALVKEYEGVRDRATSSADAITQLRMAKNIDVSTGTLEPYKASASALAEGLGFDPAQIGLESATNPQSFNAIMQNLVLTKMQAQKGPQTENDAKRITSTVAGLTNTQDAKDFLLDSAIAVAERDVEMADFYDAHRERTDSLEGARKAWNKHIQNVPLFASNPTTGRPVFFSQFRGAVRDANPEATDDQIIDLWRKKYGAR